MIWLLSIAGYFAVAAAGVVWAGYSTANDEWGDREDARIMASVLWPVGFPMLLLLAACNGFLNLADFGRALALKEKRRAQLPEARVVE
jgi:drug/metabolite transporter (DMT)-like permease